MRVIACLHGSEAIDWVEALTARRIQYSTAASAVPSSSVDRSNGKGKGPGAWMGELRRCIVMCHRLKESRIATKRFGSQSPIQSFQTHSKTMEAEALSKSAGANEQWPLLRPTRCDSPGDLEPHHVILESPVFPCGDQSAPEAAESEAVRRLIVEDDWQTRTDAPVECDGGAVRRIGGARSKNGATTRSRDADLRRR
jgi:hypothetical protein